MARRLHLTLKCCAVNSRRLGYVRISVSVPADFSFLPRLFCSRSTSDWLAMRFTQLLFWRAKDVIKPNIVDVTKEVGELTKKYSNLPESYIKRAMRQVKLALPAYPRASLT